MTCPGPGRCAAYLRTPLRVIGDNSTPDWSRVAAEDEAMNVGPWAARKRKATWQARFAVAIMIAKCNAAARVMMVNWSLSADH
jgi:hypothetical protein